MKTITLTATQAQTLLLQGFDQAHAALLTREQARQLTNWCDCQSEALWDGMSLQECLNVYRVSWEWDTWEGWSEEDRPAAHAAWNSAVIDPGNRMDKG